MSSGKSGAASQQQNYYGTIAAGICVGPVDAIVAILLGGKYWYQPATPTERTGAGITNPYIIPDTRPGARDGFMEFFWGTEEQPASAVINAYASHPPGAGACYFTLSKFLFGTGAGTPPVLEFILRRGANQFAVTVDLGRLTATQQVNPAAIGAELLTAWYGLGLTAADLDLPRLEALAQAFAADPELLDLAAGSPLWAEQAAARSHLLDLVALGDMWFRLGASGKMEVGRWNENGPAGEVTTLDATDFVDEPSDRTQDLDDIKNTASVAFYDRAYAYAKSSEAVPDAALVRQHGGTRTLKLNRNAIGRRDQARKHGSRALRQYARVILGGSGKVRRAKAVNPDGSLIRPGDWFNLDLDPEPGGDGLRVLCRCLGRISNPTGPVTLEWEVDPSAVPTPYHPSWSIVPPTEEVTGPLYYQRTLGLPPASGADPAIQLLALRHKPKWEGVNLYYDDNTDGSYTSLGTQVGFALPCSLPAALAAGDTTVRLKLIDFFAAGVPGDIDAYLLREAIGSGNEAAARNNELLLVLVKKNATTGVVLPNGAHDWVEVCSIVDVAQVAADTFDVSVLRARMGTAAQDFNTGTFPDVFYAYEGWVIPRSQLTDFTHLDFVRLVRDGTPGFFRFAPYSRESVYDPTSAYEAGLQLTPSWTPQFAYTFPSAYAALKNPKVVTVFKAAGSTPATPMGGTYASPVPAGWALTPDPSGPNYASARLFTEDGYGQDGAWSTPTRWTGVAGADGEDGADGSNGSNGNFVDYVFIRAGSVPTTPTGDNPSGWSDAPPSGSDPLYMAKATKTYAGVLIGAWSSPVRLDGPAGAAGAPGDDGASVEVEYSVDGSTSWHSTFTTGDLYMRQRVGTGAWSGAIRIVGEKGDPGGPAMFTLSLPVSGAPFNYNTGAGSYPAGTIVNISAAPTISGHDFIQWSASGDDINQVGSPGSASTTVLMNKDLTITADYT